MYTIYKCTFCGFTTDFEPTNCHICGSDDFKQEQRKQTNADRIRAMSDKELANWISTFPGGAKAVQVYEWLTEEVE